MPTRRSVIKMLALGGGALFLQQNAFCSVPKRKKLGVALVGLGYYSTDLLAPALQRTQNCYLAGIVSGTPSKVESWKKQYHIPDKNIYNYRNFDQIANNPDIDVVYVVLPPSMHHEYVIRAANAGKHVWCEKPMAITEAECREMIEACRKNSRSLAIGYRLHHEPNTIAYRKIIREKQLGAVQKLQCAVGYYETRTDHWKQKKEMGGGVMYDMGVYAIQGARLGTNMEPIAVLSAETSARRKEIYKNGLDEITKAVLQFPGGVEASISASFAENINFLEVDCEKGNLRVQPYSTYSGISVTGPLGKIEKSYSVPRQQIDQMDADALSILEGRPMAVPGEEGLRDIRIVEAIYRCAASGEKITLG